MKKTGIIYKTLLLLSVVMLLFSCTKEEEPVKRAEVEVEEFDQGFVLVKLESDPAYLDSIWYTNNTKGTSFKIEKTEFLGYDEVNNPITTISRTLVSGSVNDQVQCCFYVNGVMDVAAVFEDISVVLDSNYLDSIPTGSTGGNSIFCITGTY